MRRIDWYVDRPSHILVQISAANPAPRDLDLNLAWGWCRRITYLLHPQVLASVPDGCLHGLGFASFRAAARLTPAGENRLPWFRGSAEDFRRSIEPASLVKKSEQPMALAREEAGIEA